jgi:deazaflavin-dependent oxidoreductase (nitroreductase family)
MQLWVLIYRRTGGRLAGKMFGVPLLLLTTTGRKSGREWTVPLMYHHDGDRLVIVASAAGQPNHPAWWLNLRAQPNATVQVGKETFPVKASEATGEERNRLWPVMVEKYKGYADYQEKTSRQIPVVVLERPPAG